ncbi:UNVERIFIED_CONTAM: hypothetical protein PYX00_007385 [Menopon gallinae]|uniref:GrpE protein homolog n=1 Tax=Menopon gallinae TaxID=328185 RepID=A0AAW2HJW3_9NEOP
MAAAGMTYMRCGRFIVNNIMNVKQLANNRLKVNTLEGNKKWASARSMCASVATENTQGKPAENEPEMTEAEKKHKGEIENLNKEITGLTEKVQMLEDKYKRSLADGENLRIRFMKQVEDAKIYGIQSFCKDLLEVSDILQRATESVPKEEVNDKNPHLKSLYEGLVMTEAQLQNVFRRHGLVSVNPVNEKFDPNLHEALFQQEVEGKEAGTIVVVSKIGYKLHDRVIRPALVGVAKSS